jgi:hypothetical protein
MISTTSPVFGSILFAGEAGPRAPFIVYNAHGAQNTPRLGFSQIQAVKTPSRKRERSDLTFIHVFDGPDLYGALSFFETIPSSPSLQIA